MNNRGMKNMPETKKSPAPKPKPKIKKASTSTRNQKVYDAAKAINKKLKGKNT